MNEGSIKLRVLLIVTLCVLFTELGVAAQERAATDPVLARLGFGSGFGNCETNTATLDRVLNQALLGDRKDSAVIVIARLGRGEMSGELTRRRLYTVRAYFSARGLSSDRLVTAEGERVAGYGRIDFYIGGILFDALVADRCKDLPVGSCMEDFYVEPYYLPRKRKVRWCR
jgi:hypothetical protein